MKLRPKIEVNDTNQNIDLTKNSLNYAISTLNIDQKADILIYS